MGDRSNPSATSVILTALILICAAVVAYHDKLLLPGAGAVLAAFCAWLTVRIINRREKWAIRTAYFLAGAGTLVAIGYVFDLILHWIPRVQ